MMKKMVMKVKKPWQLLLYVSIRRGLHESVLSGSPQVGGGLACLSEAGCTSCSLLRSQAEIGRRNGMRTGTVVKSPVIGDLEEEGFQGSVALESLYTEMKRRRELLDTSNDAGR